MPPSPGGWSLTPPRARVARGRAAAARSARTAARPELGGRRRDAARPAGRAAGLASPSLGAGRSDGFVDAGLCLRLILSGGLLSRGPLGAALHQGRDPKYPPRPAGRREPDGAVSVCRGRGVGSGRHSPSPRARTHLWLEGPGLAAVGDWHVLPLAVLRRLLLLPPPWQSRAVTVWMSPRIKGS